jgi:hypothetical protein
LLYDISVLFLFFSNDITEIFEKKKKISSSGRSFVSLTFFTFTGFSRAADLTAFSADFF